MTVSFFGLQVGNRRNETPISKDQKAMQSLDSIEDCWPLEIQTTGEVSMQH